MNTTIVYVWPCLIDEHSFITKWSNKQQWVRCWADNPISWWTHSVHTFSVLLSHVHEVDQVSCSLITITSELKIMIFMYFFVNRRDQADEMSSKKGAIQIHAGESRQTIDLHHNNLKEGQKTTQSLCGKGVMIGWTTQSACCACRTTQYYVCFCMYEPSCSLNIVTKC